MIIKIIKILLLQIYNFKIISNHYYLTSWYAFKIQFFKNQLEKPVASKAA